MLFKNQYPKLLASSVDPYKLSLTIKGVLTGLVPVILVLAPMFHWSVTQQDFDNVTQGIEATIVAVTSLVSVAMVLVGAVRKILVGLGIKL